MSGEPGPNDAAAQPALDVRVIKAFFRMSSGFWSGDTRGRAMLLTAGLLGFLLASLAATLALNQWYRWFFEALERKDAATVGHGVLVLGLIIASMAAIGVGIVRTRETLQVRWREWVTGHLVGRWLAERRYYHLEQDPSSPANPEYRISDDTRWATEFLVDFAIGLFSALVGGITFVGILWSVGGALDVTIAGSRLHIPAFMVLAALAYGVTASTLMLWVGRPLVSSVVAKNEAEGHFRFAMMRVRDNAESVALASGEGLEHRRIAGLYRDLVERWLRIVRQHGNLTWITNASGPLIPIAPLLFACPKYLAGDLTFGEVMQLAGAFAQVQMAISWLVDNFRNIADWYASARRIMELSNACDRIDVAASAGTVDRLHIVPNGNRGVVLEGVDMRDRDGRPLAQPVHIAIDPGEHVVISGESGSGKSALVRLMAGLWRQARGSARLPEAGRILVAPQKPYLPPGSLREILLHPSGPDRADEAAIRTALDQVGLGQLGSRLDDDERWDRLLSAGELQRLLVARILVQRPALAVLDEALTALDEGTQRRLMELISRSAPETAVIVLTQRPVAMSHGVRQIVLGRPSAKPTATPELV